MPYVDRDTRDSLAEPRHAMTTGELNYLIHDLLHGYILVKGLRYSTINDIVGVLECAKQEFYRRLAAPYEDKKIKENGDVLCYEWRE